MHGPFRRLRNEYGLRPARTYLDELGGDLNVVCDVQEMFPQEGIPENYRIIGSRYHASDGREPDIEAFVDNHRPTLPVTVGNSGDAERFAFLRDPGYSRFNILVAGPGIDRLSGDHILARPLVNLAAVLPFVDSCSVTAETGPS